MPEGLGEVLMLGAGIPVAVAVGLAAALLWWQGWVSRALVVILLVITTLPLFGGSGDAAEGSPVRQVAWGGLFAYCLCIALRGPDGRLEFPLRWVPAAFWLLLAYCLVSVAWSPVAGASFKRWVQVFGVMLLAVALWRTSGGRAFHERLFWPGVAFAGLGIANLALNPGYAIDVEGCFRGIASHKNTWGQFCMLVAVAALARACSARRDWVAWGAFALCAVSVLLSRSSSSTLMLASICGLFLVWQLWSRPGLGGKLAVGLGGCAVLGLLYGYSLLHGDASPRGIVDAGLGLVGKNATLTGRTYLWELIQAEIARHPWLGVGYGGFWMGLAGPSAAVILRLDWGPPWQSHNGYLDVVNEIGYLGLALTAVALAQHAGNLFRLLPVAPRGWLMYHVAILLATLVGNVTETSLLRTTHFWWIVVCASVVEVQVRWLAQRAANPPLEPRAVPGELPS